MGEIHFEKLTPARNVDLKIYNDALDFVFKNDDIRNVAISGAYSAGKSSVIETYKEKHQKLNFIHISLANFKKNSEGMDNEFSKENVKESVLEGKILNQLLHQIDIAKIPQTNFRIKQKISTKRICKTTLLVMLFLLAILHIILFPQWCAFVNSLPNTKWLEFLEIFTQSISLLCSGLIATAIFGLVLYESIKIQKNKSLFKRFSVQGNEIEIFEKDDESYFDKYLNEVLYLFDSANGDVIIFEDMDRYNVTQIFQRLREVNALVNNKRTKENRKVLRFFYLLRDDIFISKDRTKFFDFIMPIIPVIDNSNSYDQFISHFKTGGVYENFNEHVLQGISLYVDDMRILKNIYNELVIYYNRIGTTEQDFNKLLAMIVYKNIFPRDFSDTQLNKGFVSTLFNNKEKIIKDSINEFDTQLAELNKSIERCKNEHIQNTSELDIIFERRFGYSYPNNPDYKKRMEIVKLIQSNQVESLQTKINELESKRTITNNKKIYELITRNNVDAIFNISYKNFLNEENSFKELKSSQYFALIKYLIWNGHIDETYEDYMTYFYPNSLTTNDKMFLRSVTDKKAKDWSYKIDNPKLVLSRLREVDFDEIEVLNFALFSYLLSTAIENKKYLIRFIQQLKDGRHFIFMKEYFVLPEDSSFYVCAINQNWSLFLYDASQRTEFSRELIKEYTVLTLYHCDNENIDLVNANDFLTKSISSDPEFLNIKNPKIEKLISEFLRLNVKFKRIDFEKANKDFFDAVYQNKLYEFTFENICLILTKIYNLDKSDEIRHKNYSLILSSPTSKLNEYVNENIDQYMTHLIDNCDKIITDRPEAALELINNENIELPKREKYIEYLQTKLTRLADIQEQSLWDLVLEKRIIEYSEANILYYYFKKGKQLNNVLSSFINSEDKKLKFSINKIDEIFGADAASSLFDNVLTCEELNNEKYADILSQIKYEYSSFSIENISVPKITILIDQKIIKMTSENVVFMRTTYKSQFIKFIKQNISEYMSNVLKSEKLTYDELLDILSLNIDDTYKIDLISHTNEVISVISQNYSDKVKTYILQNNFNMSDFEPLLKKYETLSDALKKILIELCVKFQDILIERQKYLSESLFNSILKTKEISIEIKLILLTNQIDELSKSKCEYYIKLIGSTEHEKLFGTGRPKFEVTETNKNLLRKFKNKRWISDFSETDGFYKISRRNLHTN